MDSQMGMTVVLESLQMQLAEGVDEWIMDAPIDRFALAQLHVEKPLPQSAPASKSAASDTTQQEACVDFDNAKTGEELAEMLRAALPEGAIRNAQNCFEIIGDEAAEIAVIIDPPAKTADATGDIFKEATVSLLAKSLRAIDLDINASQGKEPRANIAYLPISPWRIAQDRKLLDQEAELCVKAMEARVKMRDFKHVIFAGSNIAGVDKKLTDERFAGLETTTLIPPSLMLREPLLKRRHWQKLKALYARLDEILKR